MKIARVNGDYDTLVLTFEDGRVVEIGGELLAHGFAAYENSITEWKKPEGEPISESEKREIIEAALDEAKNSDFNLTFETYRPPTEEEKEASWKAFLERMGIDEKDVEVVE